MTQTSTTSKPSTESDTATKKKSRWFRFSQPAPEARGIDTLFDFYWGGPERRITGLTLKIIAVNAAALVMLATGTLFLGHYQKGLIETRLDTFRTEVELIAVSLSEAGTITPRHLKRLSQAMDQRIYLFGADGNLVLDSAQIPHVEELGHVPDPDDTRKTYYSIEVLKKMAGFIIQFLPERRVLPAYPESNSTAAAAHPDAADAMHGITSLSAWQDEDRHISLTAAAPMFKDGQLLGSVLMMRSGRDIEDDIGAVWVNIIKVFLITLFVTVLLSIYLSGTIAAPLRKLAGAAESLRRGKETEIPDFSNRKDEIGELSIVLREMTDALWDRMDSIERFAADVAHELKNPLTSLKSAIETAAVVKTDKDRARLMEIVAHDIERLDRLITDISDASRIDAEMSRETLESVDIQKTLGDLLSYHQSPMERETSVGPSKRVRVRNKDANLALNNMGDGSALVWGLEGRIAQVFENLVSNAISFSPTGGTVNITIVPVRKRIVVTVEDEGPGIPENKLETIFDRFYTERPDHEDYGRHSGLGLSICKQIVSALGGQIFAENIRDENNEIEGARFTVILNRAE